MSEGQKVIKYIAIAFALFLSFNIIVGIISAVVAGIEVFGDILGIGKDEEIHSYEEYFINEDYSDLKNLVIESKISNLIIKSGNELKVEAENIPEKIDLNKNGNTLKIKENKKINIFNDNSTSKIVIYVPETLKFEKIEIDTGAGNVEISKLETNNLKLDLGAGNVNIDNLLVKETSKINGGVGNVTISDTTLNDLDLDIGIGNFKIQARILGNSKIDSGVGELDLELLGRKEDYKIIAEKGVGSFKIKGEDIKDNQEYGNGKNIIEIDAGIGSIDIEYKGIFDI